MQAKRAQFRANHIILHAKCSLIELQNHLAHGITVLWVSTSSGESWSSSGRRKQPKLRVCRDTTVCLHSLLREAWREFGLAVLTLFLPSPCLELPRAFCGHAGCPPIPSQSSVPSQVSIRCT